MFISHDSTDKNAAEIFKVKSAHEEARLDVEKGAQIEDLQRINELKQLYSAGAVFALQEKRLPAIEDFQNGQISTVSSTELNFVDGEPEQGEVQYRTGVICDENMVYVTRFNASDQGMGFRTLLSNRDLYCFSGEGV